MLNYSPYQYALKRSKSSSISTENEMWPKPSVLNFPSQSQKQGKKNTTSKFENTCHWFTDNPNRTAITMKHYLGSVAAAAVLSSSRGRLFREHFRAVQEVLEVNSFFACFDLVSLFQFSMISRPMLAPSA